MATGKFYVYFLVGVLLAVLILEIEGRTQKNRNHKTQVGNGQPSQLPGANLNQLTNQKPKKPHPQNENEEHHTGHPGAFRRHNNKDHDQDFVTKPDRKHQEKPQKKQNSKTQNGQ